MYILKILTLAISIHISASPLFSSGWELLKDEDGIRLYEQSVKGSHLKEFLAVTVIDAKMEVIGEVLRDVDAQPSWMPKCLQSRIIERIDRNNLVLYTVMASQWPTKNRDIVVKNSTVYDYKNGSSIIEFRAISDKRVPLNKDRVRIEYLRGSYRMDYIARNKTKFIYRQLVDPGGSVPYKLAYMTIRGQPFKALQNLKKMVKRKKYILSALNNPDRHVIDRLSMDSRNVRETLSRRLEPYFRDKKIFRRIISENKNIFEDIIKDKGSYKSTRMATNRIINFYIKASSKNPKLSENLLQDKNLKKEITNIILYDFGFSRETVDSIVSRYLKKYSSR